MRRQDDGRRDAYGQRGGEGRRRDEDEDGGYDPKREREEYVRMRRRQRRENDQSDRRNDRREADSGGGRRRERSERTRFNDNDDAKENMDKDKDKDKKEEDADAAKFLAAKRARGEGGDLVTRTGGAYIPPARLRLMQAQITDKSSVQYQRIAWEALKKSINGLINKVNVSNLLSIIRELFQENIVRGRGLLVRSIMQAQTASQTFTHVYASLVSVINTKFPNIGELVLKRLILNFQKGHRRGDKTLCLSSLRFIAHLVNQLVVNEIIALEILMVLLDQPTDDSVELSIGFLKECGNKLKELAPKGLNGIFERLRVILHEAAIDKRVQYMIEVMFAIRKDGFKDHPAILSELDIVEQDEQFTHIMELAAEDLTSEDNLNVFKADPDYLDNEEKYKEIKKELLDEESDNDDDGDGGGDSNGSGSDDDDEEEDGEGGEKGPKTVIIDETETNLTAFRRTVYLTIQSSLDFEECAHKLLKMQMKPGQEDELCNMILDCCAQQRTYEKFFGLLGQRFCMIDKKYVSPYQRIFQEQYDTVHRLETNKLRNVAKFFAHLLHTDAISWEVLQSIRLNEDDTTSSGRIFIKILFQELSEYMGLSNLNNRLKDQTFQSFFEGLFPRDNPRNTRFAINFFTSIGLGGLTDELRDHLKAVPARPPKAQTPPSESGDSDSSSA